MKQKPHKRKAKQLKWKKMTGQAHKPDNLTLRLITNGMPEREKMKLYTVFGMNYPKDTP